MSRTGRLTLLALFFALVAAVELRLTWSTIVFVTRPETVHMRWPISDALVVGRAGHGGLQRGDRIVAVDGVPVASRWQVHQRMMQRPVGAVLPVTVERAGARVVVDAPTWSWPMGLPERVFTVLQNVVTPWFSILLGVFVVWRRPLDRLAWLVLFIMLGQLNYSYLFITDAWEAPLATLLRATYQMWNRLGFIAWLWFGYDFCAGRQWATWLRWPLSAALLAHGIQTSWAGVAGLHAPAWLPAAQAWQTPTSVLLVLIWSATLVAIANLVYRLAGETHPDTRRRLRLLLAGMLIGRGPLLFLDIASLFGRPATSWPVLVWVPAVTLGYLLVPLTFAYVLIVERAMDVGVVVRQGLQYAFARRGVEALRAVLALAPLALVENRWAAIAWSSLALLAVGPVVERLRAWIDRRFFREAVQAERVLAGLAQPLRTVREPAGVLGTVAERIAAALHITETRHWLAGQGEAPDWLGTPPGETFALPITGPSGLLGALFLGPKRSQEPYSPAEIRLLESTGHQAALAMENAALTQTVATEAAQRERIQQELEIARGVQARLLPKHDPAVPGLTLAGLCRPAQSIGGDAYDYIFVGDSHLLITVADVAGKGVPAALLMSNWQAAVRGLMSGGAFAGLAGTLGRLNELVFDSTPANRFITLFAAAYERDTRLLRYASAGHNPAALLRAGASEVEWIRTKGVALGLRRRAVFEESSLRLAPGDCLVLYTDGVTEAVNTRNEDFGEARLAEGILRHRAHDAAGMLRALVAEVCDFAGEATQHDDITMVVLRAGPEPAPDGQRFP